MTNLSSRTTDAETMTEDVIICVILRIQTKTALLCGHPLKLRERARQKRSFSADECWLRWISIKYSISWQRAWPGPGVFLHHDILSLLAENSPLDYIRELLARFGRLPWQRKKANSVY